MQGIPKLTPLQALSDFAEYVEKQQAMRNPPKATTGAAKSQGCADAADHDDLDDILNNLDLGDSAPRTPMRQLLLEPDADGSLERKLADLLSERVAEGRGEAVFDLGFENNGDSLGMSKPEWDAAYDRLVRAAKLIRADCQVLLTRNVGGEADVAAKGKETDCTGKIMVRQVPATVENVIETRIAVVGNGRSPRLPNLEVSEVLTGTSRRGEEFHAGGPCQRRLG